MPKSTEDVLESARFSGVSNKQKEAYIYLVDEKNGNWVTREESGFTKATLESLVEIGLARKDENYPSIIYKGIIY